MNNGKPIFEASGDDSAWDSAGVSSPHLIWLQNERKWRMYYIGMSGSQSSTVTAGFYNRRYRSPV